MSQANSNNAQRQKDFSITEVAGIRYLHLGSQEIQSAMKVSRPSELVLAYTQAMMGWLLLRDDAEKITQIGLGGGSLSRWISVHLPNAKQTVVEVNPYVVAVAKAHFKLPDLDSRFRIVESDGFLFAQQNPESCEVLMVDAYEAHGIDTTFLSTEFFEAAKGMLLDDGVVVMNWWSREKRFEEAMVRLLDVFDGRVLQITTQDQSNVIIFAFKNSPKYTRFDAMKTRIPRLIERFELDFNRYFAKIRAQNPHSEQGLAF